MAGRQREISVSEFFLKNRHLLGFDTPAKALVTAVKEAVDNALDACEEAEILPEISVQVHDRYGKSRVVVEDNGPGIAESQIARIFGKLLYGSKFHKLSQSRRLPEPEANQRLLDEALAEQRAENKKQLEALLADPRRFAHTETGGRLSLSPAEVEWVLQVLNDIRVGSWIMLGSPDEKRAELNEGTAPDLAAMETAGYFQMQLLQALRGET